MMAIETASAVCAILNNPRISLRRRISCDTAEAAVITTTASHGGEIRAAARKGMAAIEILAVPVERTHRASATRPRAAREIKTFRGAAPSMGAITKLAAEAAAAQKIVPETNTATCFVIAEGTPALGYSQL